MHFASCCQFLHPKTRCSGKESNLSNNMEMNSWKYWRTYPLNIELKDTGLQVLIFRQALVQEMKDYLHDLFTRMSVAGKRGRHSGIEVMSLRVAFIIPVYKNRGSDSRWVTREIVIFLWVWWQLKGYGEVNTQGRFQPVYLRGSLVMFVIFLVSRMQSAWTKINLYGRWAALSTSPFLMSSDHEWRINCLPLSESRLKSQWDVH